MSLKNGFLKGLIYIIFVLGASAALAAFAASAASDAFAFGKSGAKVTVTVPEGADTEALAGIYAEAGLVRYPKLYTLYSRLRGDDGKYLSGDFTLGGGLDYDELRRAVKAGRGVRTQIKLTFPEGSDTDDIIDIFIENKIGTREKFIEVISDFDFGFDFLADIKPEGRKYRLEGYLFPDTYYFYSDSTETEAIYKMLSNFDAKFTSQMRGECAAKGFTVDEIVTLASIIEKEAYYKKDMAFISSVFVNRLKSKTLPRLESDATVVYARDAGNAERGGEPSGDDMQIDSPYNTYRKNGLPPGAICSPGLDAVEAAISPAVTDYYYFVCKKDKTAVFSRTYSEHLRAVAAIRNG